PGATSYVVDEIATLATAGIGTLDLVPGDYHFAGGGLDFYFEVTASGAVTYPASLEGTLFGNGTAEIAYGHPACATSADCAAGHVCEAGACAPDRAPPTVSIAPLPAATNAPSLDVRAAVADDGSIATVVVLRDGVAVAQPTPDGSGEVDATVPLVEGANAITVVATDAAGNSAGASATVTLDTRPPAISIGSPVAGQDVGTAALTVAAQIVEPLASTVTIGDADISLPAGGGLASAVVSLTASGLNAIVVSATDAAGNVATAEVDVFVDLAAPTLSVDVADGATYGGSLGGALPVHLVVEDVGATTVTFSSGATASLPRGGGAVDAMIPLTEGTTTFTATVVNEAGHTATLARTVRYDATPPAAAFASPAPGAFARGTIELAAEVTDAVSGVGSVAFAIDGGAPIDAVVSGDVYTLAVDTSAFADGPHEASLVAVDAAGNRGSASVAFVVDNAAPVAAIDAPSAGAYVSGTVDVRVSATDATSGVAAIDVAVDGRAVATCAASPCDAT
ncbi:MAG TPA: Ig-like domain-containing protein, partial [Minicystis sp.]|nr:Ig-like domain-containing protein [Minicystis sp.]